jgi:O-antigen/teichoic acid export membrane protein
MTRSDAPAFSFLPDPLAAWARRLYGTLGLSGRIVRNSLLLIAANSAGKVFALVLNALIIWGLGDQRFGEFRAAVAWAGVFANIAELGLLRPGARAVARAPRRAREIFRDILKTKIILGAGAILLLVALTETGFRGDPLFRALVYLWFGAILAQGVKRACDCVFMGLQRMGYTAAFMFANRFATMLLSGFYLLASDSLVGLMVLFLAIEATEAAFQCFAALRLAQSVASEEAPPTTASETAAVAEPPADVPSADVPSGWVAWAREGLPFGAHELALEISFRIDSVMLYAGAGAVAVATYNKAYLILTSVLMLPNALCQALFPALSEMHRRDPRDATEHFRRSLPLFVLAGPALMAMLLAVKEPILWALKGQEAEVLQIYIVSMATLPIFFLSMPLGYFLGVIYRQGDLALIAGMAAAANVAMNLSFIPQWGAWGAAAATLATELLVLALIIRSVAPGFGRAFDGKRLLGFAALQAMALALGWRWLNGDWLWRIAFFALYLPPVAWLGVQQRRSIRETR